MSKPLTFHLANMWQTMATAAEEDKKLVQK
jgi:hypothetical protein